MKKITLALFCFGLALFTTNTSKAQAFDIGTSVINVGIGIGGWYSFSFGAPGISGSYEYGMIAVDDFGVIGLGVFTGFRRAKEDTILGDITYSNFIVAPRGTFHFVTIPVENLDVYAALNIIVAFERVDSDFGTDFNDTDFRPSLTAGARYYFNENVAIYGELGYSLNYLTVGAAFRI